MRFTTNYLSMSRSVLLAGLALLCLMLGFAWYSSAQALAADARKYADAYKALSDAAFLPGAAANPVRSAANRALVEVLTGTLSSAERIERAQDGQSLLKDIELEIDAIPDARSLADSTRERLVARQYTLGGMWHAGRLRDIGGLAAQQGVLVEDIRGLSYGANYHTDKIFSRVIADNGLLDSAFVATLNAEIPQVEEQFNRRSNLYTDLQQVDYKMETLLESLGVPR